MATEKGGVVVLSDKEQKDRKGREAEASGSSQVEVVRVGAQQQVVLEWLMAGKSVSETARLSKISRATVYVWLKRDPNFLAAYNQWQDEMQEHARAKLTNLMDRATNAVSRALDAGDARLGLQLLKGLGVLGPGRKAQRVEGKGAEEKEWKAAEGINLPTENIPGLEVKENDKREP